MVYKYLLKGIDCPHCAGKIENLLLENQNILKASINLSTQQLEIDIKSDDMVNINANFDNQLSKAELLDFVTQSVHNYEPEVEVLEITTGKQDKEDNTACNTDKPAVLKIKSIKPIKDDSNKANSVICGCNKDSVEHSSDKHSQCHCHEHELNESKEHSCDCRCHDEDEDCCCKERHDAHDDDCCCNRHNEANVQNSCCCSQDTNKDSCCSSSNDLPKESTKSSSSKSLSSLEGSSANTVMYYLRGLDCPHCSALIEGEVKELPGVKDCTINLINGRITIVFEETNGNKSNGKHSNTIIDRNELFARLEQIVHSHEPDVEVESVDTVLNSKETKKARIEEEQREQKEYAHRILRLWCGGAIFVLGLLLFYLTDLNLFYAKVPVFVIAYIILGYDVLVSAVTSIGRGQVFNENFLMSISTVGAFGIQEFPEAVAVMFFFQLGEYFEDRAVNSSRKSIVGLMALKVEYANLKTSNGLEQVDPEDVKVNDLIVVKPGERVPLDGCITEGTAMADTVALTGESVPVSVHTGDEILSGTIIKDAAITVKVSKIYSESTVARIIDLVENSASRKSKAESFISKFARYYTPLVVISAVFVALCPPLFFGEAWSTWLNRAFVFLVISCPCALVISVPLTFFGGIGAASRKGILIKGSNYLEALNDVSTVIFDKTGTLTKGVFNVTKITPEPTFTENQLLTYAAYAEILSNHPIAKSIMKSAIDSGIVVKDELVKDYLEISGHGIAVKYDNKCILAGNTKLMKKYGIAYKVTATEGTLVYIAYDNKFIGSIAISDELKSDSVLAISKLKESGVSKTVMLTGDRKEIAEVVASKLNIDEYHAELLPIDKVTKLEELDKNKTGNLVFVGDGINDAPVLARADIGIAMGALGSEAAAEAADIVLMNDEPSKVAEAISIAAKTRSVVIQNIVFALGVKILLLILGLFGFVGLWFAVFGDVGVMVIAICNAMRMLRIK